MQHLLVDKLVVRGLIDRQINPENRRAPHRWTPSGEKAHARTPASFNAGQQKILAVLRPAERELLLDLLVRVVEGNASLWHGLAQADVRAPPRHRRSELGDCHA